MTDSTLMAAIDGNMTVIRYLVEHGADVNAQGGEYGNPLQAAVVWNCIEIVRYLVENGADVNAQGGECGNPLQAAVTMNRVEIVRYLVENGADVNAQGGKYGNALSAAEAKYRHNGIVWFLLDRGASRNAKDGG
jgi:ankyrin repeat protein